MIYNNCRHGDGDIVIVAALETGESYLLYTGSCGDVVQHSVPSNMAANKCGNIMIMRKVLTCLEYQ